MVFTTVAGSTTGFSGDLGPATNARLNEPSFVIVVNGSIIIADRTNNRIRSVGANGEITTIVGSGQSSVTPAEDLVGTTSALFFPIGLASDGTALIISDQNNGRIRRLQGTAITTIAGSGNIGFADGPALQGEMRSPFGLLLLPDGSLLIADEDDNRIRLLKAGVLSTVAGDGNADHVEGVGTQARLRGPLAMALVAGELYWSEAGNHIIRKFASGGAPSSPLTGVSMTLAGQPEVSGFADGTPGLLSTPCGLLDFNGKLLIADTDNQRVRLLDIGTGILSTIAGTGACGSGGDGLPLLQAQLCTPFALFLEDSGSILLSQRDAGGRVRRMAVPTTAPTTAPTRTPTSAPSTAAPSSPTTSPTPAPTTAPTPGCDACALPQCSNETQSVAPGQCGALRLLHEVIGWNKNIVPCVRVLRDAVCSGVRFLVNSSADCFARGPPPADPTFCSLLPPDVRDCIRPDLLARFGADICPRQVAPQPVPKVSFPPPVVVVNVSGRTGLTVFVDPSNLTGRPEPCFELSTLLGRNASRGAELGSLASLADGPQGSIPGLNTTRLDAQSLFTLSCMSLQEQGLQLEWLYFLGPFGLVLLVCAVGAFARCHKQPLVARNPVVFCATVLLLALNATLTSLDALFHFQVGCWLLVLSNVVAFPLLVVAYLTAAMRLLFLYHWNRQKASKGSSSWYWEHRYLVSSRFLLAWLLGHLALYGGLFGLVGHLEGTFGQQLLDSGRCEWWDVNQQVVDAAAAEGVILDATSLNPNGFVPFSPEYSTCVFCLSVPVQLATSAYTCLLLVVLVATLLMLRHVDDQYLIWKECVGALVALFVIGASRGALLATKAAQQITFRIGPDYMGMAFGLGLCLLMVGSLVWPLLATCGCCARRRGFSGHGPTTRTAHRELELASTPWSQGASHREANPATLGHDDDAPAAGAGLRPPKPISPSGHLTIEDVLADPVALALFRQCAVECFVGENIAYLVDIQALANMEPTSEEFARAAVAIKDSYLTPGAMFELNVSAPLRRMVCAEFDAGPVSAAVFEAATREVCSQMYHNEFRIFLKSQHYTALMAAKQKDGEVEALVGAVFPLHVDAIRRRATATIKQVFHPDPAPVQPPTGGGLNRPFPSKSTPSAPASERGRPPPPRAGMKHSASSASGWNSSASSASGWNSSASSASGWNSSASSASGFMRPPPPPPRPSVNSSVSGKSYVGALDV